MTKRISDQNQRIVSLDPAPTSDTRNRNRYLDAIDGMLFGDDPDQGMIRGNNFLHPALRLAFTAPDNFAMMNTASAVIGLGPDDVRFLFTGGTISANTTTRFYLDQSWASLFEGEPPAALGNIRTLSTNGMEGITGIARLDGEGAGLDVRLVRVQGSRLLHVRVGRFDSSAQASVFFRSVTSRGFTAAVVRDVQQEEPIRG